MSDYLPDALNQLLINIITLMFGTSFQNRCRYLFTVSFIAFVAMVCYAENKTITLIVEDEQHEPVIGATVSLVVTADTTFVDAKISDTQGKVTFSYDTAQQLTVLARSIGYETYSSPLDKVNGNIILTPTSTELSEVTVTARVDALQHKAGKFIFDPSDLIKKMPTMYDVLEFTPLLEVSQGSIAILGKGQSVIFVNGRSTGMGTDQLMQVLRSLPSNIIKSIEIITNPGASYSASMSGGIINIILHEPGDGYLGNVGMRLSYENERVSPTISSYNSFTKGKLNLTANVTYKGYATHAKETTDYVYGEDLSITNRTNSSSWSNSVGLNLRASYFLTGKSEVGLYFSIGASGQHGKSVIESSEVKNGVESIDKSRIDTRAPWSRPGYGFGGYYSLKTDDRGSNLDITLGYGDSQSKKQIDYRFEEPDYQREVVKADGIGFSAKYRYVVNDRHSIAAGYQIGKSKIDNDFDHEPASNRFIYKEMINSGFAEWEAEWSNAFSTKAGLRVENSDITGNQVTIGELFKQNYTDLFPSLSLSIKLPWRGNHSISLDAERSIFRPFYSRLNPFVTWTSETTCKKGNIDLKPDYNWYYSLYYSFLKYFTLGVSYSLSTNSAVDYQYRDGDITVSSTRNFGTFKNVYNFLTYNNEFFDRWNLKATLYAYYSSGKAELDGADLGFHDWDYSFQIDNSIQLSKSKDIRMTVGYRYMSPGTTIRGRSKSMNHMSLSVSKNFINGLSLSLYASGLINTHKDYRLITPDYSYWNRNELYSGSFYLNISYTFGNRMVKSSNKNVGDSPIKSRMGN